MSIYGRGKYEISIDVILSLFPVDANVIIYADTCRVILPRQQELTYIVEDYVQQMEKRPNNYLIIYTGRIGDITSSHLRYDPIVQPLITFLSKQIAMT